jgi:hypothetical protein
LDFACEMQARVLNGADGFDALKGQGFSRAAKQPEVSWALAPEGWFEKAQYIPQRLKPAHLYGAFCGTTEVVPFKTRLSPLGL